MVETMNDELCTIYLRRSKGTFSALVVNVQRYLFLFLIGVAAIATLSKKVKEVS